jgi:hypothetical protein
MHVRAHIRATQMKPGFIDVEAIIRRQGKGKSGHARRAWGIPVGDFSGTERGCTEGGPGCVTCHKTQATERPPEVLLGEMSKEILNMVTPMQVWSALALVF